MCGNEGWGGGFTPVSREEDDQPPSFGLLHVKKQIHLHLILLSRLLIHTLHETCLEIPFKKVQNMCGSWSLASHHKLALCLWPSGLQSTFIYIRCRDASTSQTFVVISRANLHASPRARLYEHIRFGIWVIFVLHAWGCVAQQYMGIT